MKILIEESLKSTLRSELASLNDRLENLANETDGFLGDLRRYILIGSGKRVRPALVTLTSRLGNSNPSHVQTVSMAVELVHIATLVHDDVIDNAVLRRGRKTVAAEHGVDAAVLLGDHVYTYAFEKVAELNNPPILGLLAKSTSVMCSGEIGQLKNRFKFDLSEKEYFTFIEKKTASLFGASARSGAILAGQSEEIQVALENYGIYLGLAFQITDDLLDLTGEESVVGKTLRTDLTNGKMTLPLIFFRNHLKSEKDTNEFIESLQHPNGQISSLIQLMKDSGAIDYAEQVAQDQIEKALMELDALPSSTTKTHLVDLAKMLQRRKA